MSLTSEVADRRHAGNTKRSDDAGFRMIASLVLRRKAMFALLVLISTSTVSAIHLWMPLYEAQSTLFFETTSSSSLQAMSAKLGTFGLQQEDEGRVLDRYAVRLNTTEFYKSVAAQLRGLGQDLEMFHREMLNPKRRAIHNFARFFNFKLSSSTMADLSDEEIAGVLDDSVYFSRNGADRLGILVRSGDRRSASIVANVIADMSVKILQEENLKDLDETRSYIEAQVAESEKAIHSVEDSLAKLKADHGILGDNGGNVAAAIQRQLTEVRLSSEENRRKLDRLQGEYEQEKLRDGDVSSNANIDPANRYGIPRRIVDLKRSLDTSNLTSAALKALLDETLHGTQNDEQRIFDLRKRMEFEYTIYQELKKEAFQLEMKRIGTRNRLRVFEHAREAEARRSDSLPVKLAIALILAIFVGLPVAMIWEIARPLVRSGKDLSDSGLAYLGGVPAVSSPFAKGSRHQPVRISRFDADSEVSMAFIQIRSRLLYLADRRENGIQIISIVSAKPSEGKSFFSRNLAACFGHMGRKTLLIDCDLRKAQSSEYFAFAQVEGLGEVLNGKCKFGSVLRKGVTSGLDLLPAGMIKTNITDLFADVAFIQLMHDLREVYDHVILDTPSLIAVPDAPLIVRTSDLPILIASMNETTQHELEISLERLRALWPGEICATLNRATGGQTPLYAIHNGGSAKRFTFPGQKGKGADAS